MVENYLADRCRYLAGSLKPFILLLPKETTRIDYIVDNFKCEVNHIHYTQCYKINGFQAMLNVTESVDERLDFSTRVTVSMREQWGEVWVSMLNQLKGMNVYVVVEDYNGVQYIQSPEFTSSFEYTYNFDTASNNGHIAQITYDCDSNNPVVILDEKITESSTYGDTDCAYQDGTVRNFKMCPYQYVFIDNNVNTGQFTTITCTGGEAMHQIDFTRQSFQFRQQYDGRNYQERLTFRIPLSDYKYYFRYNLVAFMQNRYAITFETGQGNWIAAGFEFGFMPTYTVETSESVEELNFVEITLQHTGQNSIFYCSDRTPTIIDSTTDVFVPVTQPIKDPYNGLNLEYFFCNTKTTAIYTLAQMVTESGVPTDRYICLEGYDTYYEHINIVGTYNENGIFTIYPTQTEPQRTGHLDFELTFSNYDCAILDNCKFTKMTKEVYSFSNIADYYDVHIQNPCPWTLNDIPSWITASRLSGSGGIDYVVRFTSREDATDTRKISIGYLQSFDNISSIQFILEKKVDWINPYIHNIDARNQIVTSYINLDYSQYEICGQDEGITVEKIRGTSTVKISVPENPSESETRTFTIRVCNLNTGESGNIYIYQDHMYVRWVEDAGTYICLNGNSYRRVVKYKGYSADNINIMTSEYTTGAMLVQSDPKCHYDGGDDEKYGYQWRDVDGYICIGTDKWSKQQKWETFDNGISWNATAEYQKYQIIEADSSDCQDLPQKNYKWIVDESQYDCYGTSSYYKECQWWSYDNIEWYIDEETDCRMSTTLRKENDVHCGGGGVTPGYNEKWERSTETYCKEGFLFYLERKYKSSDGGVNWTATDEYREGNVNSGQTCSDSQTKNYTWRIDYGTYVCDDYTSYYVEKYYYYYSSAPNVYILVEPMQTRKSSTVKMSNDPACGYVDNRQYRWNTNTGHNICNGNNLYKREDYEYSTDGVTWLPTGEYRIGELVEEDSPTCTQSQKYYDWRIDTTRYYCVGTTSFNYEVRYESTDNVIFVKSEPEVTQLSPTDTTKRTENDPACGASNVTYRWVEDGDNYICDYADTPPMDNTRWVELPRSSWVCDGWNLYKMEKEQITSNGGLTWSDTGQTRQSTQYEANASECSQKTNCIFANGAGRIAYDCDGNRTTTAQAIYLDYVYQWNNSGASYIPKIRIVTNSPQGNSWYNVVLSSHTVEGVTYPSYRIDIPDNRDEGTINCYWEIYNWQTNQVLHTTDTFTITRNKQI